jgi:hypothetical protein
MNDTDHYQAAAALVAEYEQAVENVRATRCYSADAQKQAEDQRLLARDGLAAARLHIGLAQLLTIRAATPAGPAVDDLDDVDDL